eukprot:evm.model.NODE_11814_length_25847_cov_20.343870.2
MLGELKLSEGGGGSVYGFGGGGVREECREGENVCGKGDKEERRIDLENAKRRRAYA